VSDLAGLVSTSRKRERSLDGRKEGGGKRVDPLCMCLAPADCHELARAQP